MGIFLYSGYQIIDYYYQSYQYRKENDQLVESIQKDNDQHQLTFKEKYAKLIKKNKDFIGWLEIKDTEISYPVMYTPHDPEYYLRRDFDGNYDVRGTIFIDARTDLLKPSDNMILYGHHMHDSTMFGPLRNYKKQDYYQKHPLIHLEMEKGSFDYEIFAVFRTVDNPNHELFIDYYKFIDATGEQHFDSYIQNFINRSFYDTGIVPKYGDQLLTLSTCEYTEENGRLVVVAKKIETVK